MKQECYLRSLFEKGEVPTLTPDDQIFIPEDFSPDGKHKDFYRDKFNTHQKNWVNRMVIGFSIRTFLRIKIKEGLNSVKWFITFMKI